MIEVIEKNATEINKQKIDPTFLKDKKKEDLFYLPLQYLRPGVVAFPKRKLERRMKILTGGKPYLTLKLNFDQGKAYKGLDHPFRVILSPDHAFAVFDDDYYELYIHILNGARSIPVKVSEDDSALYEENLFWKKLQDENKVYLYDLEGNFHHPPSHFQDLEDIPIVSNLDVMIPEILSFSKPPERRMYYEIDTLAGVRMQEGSTQFLSYHLAKMLKTALQKPKFEEYKEDKAIQDLFIKDSPLPTEEVTEKVRELLYDQRRDLEDWKGAFILDEKEDIHALNLQKLTGHQGQIAKIKINPPKKKD